MRNWASDVQMTPYERDRAIGRAVGMAPSAVHAAYRRLVAGGPGTRAR